MPRFTKETAAEAGRRSVNKLSPQYRSLRASKLGNTTLHRYGSGYYAAIARRRRRTPCAGDPKTLVQLLRYFGWEWKNSVWRHSLCGVIEEVKVKRRATYTHTRKRVSVTVLTLPRIKEYVRNLGFGI